MLSLTSADETRDIFGVFAFREKHVVRYLIGACLRGIRQSPRAHCWPRPAGLQPFPVLHLVSISE